MRRRFLWRLREEQTSEPEVRARDVEVTMAATRSAPEAADAADTIVEEDKQEASLLPSAKVRSMLRTAGPSGAAQSGTVVAKKTPRPPAFAPPKENGARRRVSESRLPQCRPWLIRRPRHSKWSAGTAEQAATQARRAAEAKAKAAARGDGHHILLLT